MEIVIGDRESVIGNKSKQPLPITQIQALAFVKPGFRASLDIIWASIAWSKTSMATVMVLEFMQKTAEDESLRQQLEALLGVGDGNISSEAELDAAESEALEERAPVVVEFAAKNGFSFSTDELVAVVEAFQKHQAGEISDDDFVAVLGAEVLSEDGSTVSTDVTSPLQWLVRYLSKTYLGY